MTAYSDWFEAARCDNVPYIQQHLSTCFTERDKKRLNFTALLTAAHYQNVDAFATLLPYEIGLCTEVPFSLACLTSRGYTTIKIHTNTSVAQYCVYRNFYAGADMCLRYMMQSQYAALRGSCDGAGKTVLTALLELGTPECTALLRRYFRYFLENEIEHATLDPLYLALIFGRVYAVQLFINAFKYHFKYAHQKLVERILLAMHINPSVYGLFQNENFATTDEIDRIKPILERIMHLKQIKRIEFVYKKEQLDTCEVLSYLKADLLEAHANKQFPTDLAAQSSKSYIEFLKTKGAGENDEDGSDYEEEQD